MKKIWIHKSHSFKEANEFDREYYFKMTPKERLNIMQELREMYYKFSKPFKGPKAKYGYRKRLQRVIKVIPQIQS